MALWGPLSVLWGPFSSGVVGQDLGFPAALMRWGVGLWGAPRWDVGKWVGVPRGGIWGRSVGFLLTPHPSGRCEH